MKIRKKKLIKQESFPVGCVPSAFLVLGVEVPPRRQTRVGRPLPPVGKPPCGDRPPPAVNRQTCVRTLPCPKLRLRAVTGNAGSRIFVSIIPLLSHYCVVNARGTTLCEEYENVYTDWVTLFTVDASYAGETGEKDRSQRVVTVITGWIPNVLLPMTLKKWHLKAVLLPFYTGKGAQYLISYGLSRNP